MTLCLQRFLSKTSQNLYIFIFICKNTRGFEKNGILNNNLIWLKFKTLKFSKELTVKNTVCFFLTDGLCGLIIPGRRSPQKHPDENTILPKSMEGSMLLGQNLRGVHHFGFYCIFIDKFFEISHRGSMSANPITPLTPPTVYINDEALKMKLSSVTISKKIEKRKK